MEQARAFVTEAEIRLAADSDPAAVGAAVTVALCGHWEHDGPCRWPHNNAIRAGREPASFRTVFVADAAEAPEVRRRIEASLRDGSGWDVLSVRERDVAAEERALAERLLAGPRRTA